MLTLDDAPFALGAAGVGGAQGEAVLLNNGDLFVVWTNTVSDLFPGPGSDVSATAVLGRVFAPDGSPRGDAFQVNTTELFYQQDPEVTVLNNGNVVIAWTDMPFGSTGTDARARIFSPAGAAVSDEILLATTMDGEQRIPQIAATPDGGFLAIWNDDRAENFGRYFNADGSPVDDDFNVASFFGERLSSLVVLDNGHIRYVSDVDLWKSDGTISRYSAASPGALNATSVSNQDTYYAQQFETAMAKMTGDRYATVGVVSGPDGYQVVARVQDASNYDNYDSPPGSTIRNIAVSQTPFTIDAQNNVHVDVTGLASGGFAVTWAQFVGDGLLTRLEIRVRAFAADLSPLGDEAVLYPETSGAQAHPFVVEMADGRLFVGWNDTGMSVSSVPSELVGQFLTVGEGGGTGNGPHGILLEGSEDPDRLSGSLSAESLDGRGGDDLLLGDGFDPSYAPEEAATVFRLYQATLDRAPNASGLANWTERLYTGERSLLQVTDGFVKSPEFRATYGALDNEGFVTLLYRNVLDRDPDAQGLGNWTARLDDGMSRAQVVRGFAQSGEFTDSTAADARAFGEASSQAGWSDDVYRLYRATLDRDPDLRGFTNWTGRLAEGADPESVTDSFVRSPEFQATYGALDNEGFVTLLYRNVLDRDPDAQGLGNWTARLDDGMSRAQVVRGFAQSGEFVAGTADDLKDWMRGLDHGAGDGYHDWLIGGTGDNTLAGGLFADVFEFAQDEGGSHRVLDLEAWDYLMLDGFGYDSAADARAHMTRSGTDVVFADQGVEITFADTRLNEIANDMLLV
ncbi:DUF4214 domain-containing protein [Salipiger abyssi]|uniref:DUF4214 domain-containing protein n=1 Tax=Salipiger abyssi TaxID=1250539 RepID=UPI001A8D3B42|nr:DUF4214 domain-containing protein [Salipiger abyssi]MBN9889848.1 DUF4214 domain-containing protein [Salipiger abyssi]